MAGTTWVGGSVAVTAIVSPMSLSGACCVWLRAALVECLQVDRHCKKHHLDRVRHTKVNSEIVTSPTFLLQVLIR